MPPFLAFCLTLVFIAWLLYRNAKGRQTTSAAVWLAVVWLGTLASRPLSFWFEGTNAAQSGSIEDGSPIDRNTLLILIIAAFIVLKRRGLNWGWAIRSNRWLWLFYFYLLVSVVWSDFPFVAFKRWFREFGNLLMILLILTEEDPGEAVRQVFVRCAYILIPLSVLLIKYYPVLGKDYNQWTGAPEYCGVAAGKNDMGRLAMLSGIFMLWTLVLQPKAGLWKWIKEGAPTLMVLVMCGWILHIADSQTSLGSFVIGAGVLFASRVSWVHSNPKRLAWLGWMLILVSCLFLCIPNLRQVVTGTMGRQVNLTDRTEVWEGVIAADTNPLIGTGFASFWLTPEGRALGQRLSVGEAHNGYLETYVNGGVIGVGLLLAVLVAAGGHVFRQFVEGSVTAPLYASLFFTGIIYNYTEANFNTNSAVGFVVWLVAMQYRPVAEYGVVGAPNEPGPGEPNTSSSFGLLLRKD